MSNKPPVLGIIGGGQLGSMLANAAKKLNIKTIILSDDQSAPGQKFCDKFFYSSYKDEKKINSFIDLVDIVTFEFENIPYDTLKNIEKFKPVLPIPEINKVVQNRKKEKLFLNEIGIRTTEWAFINSKNDIKKNISLLPGILKTYTSGYDGKGQFVINSLNDVKEDWCFSTDYILEKKVNLKKEISIIITRFKNGKTVIYDPIENIHQNQILKKSKIPADIESKLFQQSQKDTKNIAKNLNFVGTMCVEYFIDHQDVLLANEIAPRVHNSGHLTINAYNISQFECHIRAICNLEMITLKKIKNAEMFNIIGSEIEDYRNKSYKKNEFFFDYLKKEIKDKRKMGHLTVLMK